MRNYDYDSQSSKRVMVQIKAAIREGGTKGRTQKRIAEAVDMTPSSIGRYLTYMADHDMIHIAQYSEATQGGHKPALYKLGKLVLVPERRKKPAYMNDELLAAFFGAPK